MNPFIYKEFQSDMIDAVDDFINKTNFFIESVDESSIILTDNNFVLSFYLDGASMVTTISTNFSNSEESLFDFFSKRKVGNKYPFDKDKVFSYREWNKYKVKKILKVLMTDLKEYI